jgi:hypothetical protein
MQIESSDESLFNLLAKVATLGIVRSKEPEAGGGRIWVAGYWLVTLFAERTACMV